MNGTTTLSGKQSEIYKKINKLLKAEENGIAARSNLFTGLDPDIERARVRAHAFRQALECFVDSNDSKTV